MKDNCDREIKHIRFSVTSKCNYNCIYCDREGFNPKTTELSVDEINQLCRILAQILKVTKIKFTGGEPLLREEIVEIIRNVSALQLYKDISMTTNGVYLIEKAQDLYDAGLNRINVSLGTLKPDIYKKIYGSDSLETVLKGLMIAKEVGLTPIKLNYVVLKGINDQEVDDLINFCAEHEFILQLIELHEVSRSISQDNGFYEKYYFDVTPLLEEFERKAIDIEIRGNMQNAKSKGVYTTKLSKS